jgi:hypothetical protein
MVADSCQVQAVQRRAIMRINRLINLRVIAKSALLCGTAVFGVFLITDLTRSAQANDARSAPADDASSAQEVQVRQEDGQTYVVTPDNSAVLRVEPTADTDRVSPCTPETPCRYDDFEEGAEFVLTPGS